MREVSHVCEKETSLKCCSDNFYFIKLVCCEHPLTLKCNVLLTLGSYFYLVMQKVPGTM